MDQSVWAAHLAVLSITTYNSHKITMQDAEVRLGPGLRSGCPGPRRSFTDGIANVSFLRQTHINHANDWLYKCTRVCMWIKPLVFAFSPAPPPWSRHSGLDDIPMGQLDIHCRQILHVSKHYRWQQERLRPQNGEDICVARSTLPRSLGKKRRKKRGLYGFGQRQRKALSAATQRNTLKDRNPKGQLWPLAVLWFGVLSV